MNPCFEEKIPEEDDYFTTIFRFLYLICLQVFQKLLYTALLCISFLFLPELKAQFSIRGTVWDSSRRYGIESVTVLSTGGNGTVTDSMGRYQLKVTDKDSIWFSYQGKATPKYSVAKVNDVSRFEIVLHIPSRLLDEVRIRNRNYKEDSITNRRDYAKGFDFRRPTLGSMTSVSSSGVGFDIQEIIRLFQFAKNKRMEKFRERLIEQEREAFVTRKFSKGLVKRLTGLEGTEQDKFMVLYRPSYEFALLSSEYDFQLYIKEAGELFKKNKTEQPSNSF